jgi:hypothetical protein
MRMRLRMGVARGLCGKMLCWGEERDGTAWDTERNISTEKKGRENSS